ncbi:MAG TPA: 50S ribosomal protein L6 [Alphaproteobacteria bacterium]|nr:50S ribosomal protein L6 [Alphaproteobacteria bacterium]HAJ45538.1 50S ribosomal protein L6 [Alphaproteobacteria bacterium]
MSRIGKKPVAVPSGVTANVTGQMVKVKGPKGELSLKVVDELAVEMAKDGVQVTPRVADRRSLAMWGMQRTLISNMVTGVSKGYTRNLDIAGVGFRAAVQGKNLQLQLGYSHDVVYPIPAGIDIKCEKPTMIAISGIDAQRVGQVAAEIRGFREPEPYKGKGIKYSDEVIRRKEGKKK